jgi:hypothetical protein
MWKLIGTLVLLSICIPAGAIIGALCGMILLPAKIWQLLGSQSEECQYDDEI